MESYFLGRTGLTVSRLGLGMAALGRPGYINLYHGKDLGDESSEAAMEHRAHRVLDTAWDNGVRYFDVARSYGRGEKFLGSWLRSRSIPRPAVTVGSKWGYTYTADWKIEAESHEIKNHTLSTLQKQWGETVSWLNGYVGLYQVHSVTMESEVLDDRSVLDELARLKFDAGNGDEADFHGRLSIRRVSVLTSPVGAITGRAIRITFRARCRRATSTGAIVDAEVDFAGG